MSPSSTASGLTRQASGDEDLALVERARSGDPLAFEAIMRQHNRLLFRSARSVVADDAEAQDAVQEAWLRAFAHLGAYRGDAALSTWLARIAFNAAVDLVRRKGRLVEWGDSEADDGASPPENAMSEHSASEAPDVAAERRELRDVLQSAIGRLPPIYRSVFILRAVEEVSVEEAARCLQVSDAVIRTRYLRARSMLRELIGRQVEARAPDAFQFDGRRCDAVVGHVLAELTRAGLIRPH